MRTNLITRLKEEWNNLDPVDPLRGLLADAIDALAEQPAQQQEHVATCKNCLQVEELLKDMLDTLPYNSPDYWISRIKEVLPLYTSPQPAQQEQGAKDDADIYEFWARNKEAEQPAQEPVAIEYWLQDTMESGRWVTTDNMAKATAEKMLSGEYGDVYPQGRIVEPSPPASKPWVGLTTADLDEIDAPIRERGSATIAEIYRAIEAKLKEKNARKENT